MITVYKGALAPEALSVTITRGRNDMDLSTVTAVTFLVRSTDGTVNAEWSASVVSSSATQLIATHQFAAGDVAAANTLRIMPKLTLPTGVRRCVPFNLEVSE
jgi:methyl coenzyme M reductase alpha subunit